MFETTFAFYRMVKAILALNGKSLDADTTVLDFGCAWGRIIRFFLKDCRPQNVFGVDVQEKLLSLARRDVPHVRFEKIDAHPPLAPLGDTQFDVIYAYSVFSHLPEHMVLSWTGEFARRLRRGGFLFVTTRPRQHISAVHDAAHPDRTAHTAFYADLMNDPESALRRYDSGDLVHYPQPSGLLTEWGETMIPASYAQLRMTGDLDFAGYLERYSPHFLQPVIILRKP